MLYAEWIVPDHPLVPRHLRGATVSLRHDSTADELERDELVGRHLLLISPYDPCYRELFGVREFSESVNHDYKRRFVNNRARSFGLARRRLDVLGYIAAFNIESLVMWRKKTGGDISRWLGCYEPPG